MFRIAKQFTFCASHRLAHLAAEFPDHQCARLHGHNYVVEIELQSDRLDDSGFVLDYGALREVGAWIDAAFDHRHLNDVAKWHHPELSEEDAARMTTAENLAAWIFGQVTAMGVVEVTAVRVSETPKTWAEYRPAPLVHYVPVPYVRGAAVSTGTAA